MKTGKNYLFECALQEMANAKMEYYRRLAIPQNSEIIISEPQTDVFVSSKKEPDKKQRVISSLISQRDDFSEEVMKYLLYMKHAKHIKPTKQIREALLNGKKLKLTNEILNLDMAMRKSKIPEDVTVYRCSTPMDFGLPMETDDFIKMFYKEGELFRIPIYPRTTLRKDFAKQYARACIKKNIRPIIFKINLPKGTRAIYLDDMDGIARGIRNWNEQEIALERNRTFKFKSHTSHRYYEEIEIDRVPRWKIPFWKKIHDFRKEIGVDNFGEEIKL